MLVKYTWRHKTIHRLKINIDRTSLFWLPQKRDFQELLRPLVLGSESRQEGGKLSKLNTSSLSNRVSKNKMWAKFTAWAVGVLWQCGRELVWEVGSQGSLLALASCCTATADAQVGGRSVGGILKGDHHAVHQTSEGTDVIIIQVLVDIVDGGAHHDEEQELEQQRQVASRSWHFAGWRSTAPSGQSLWERAGLGVDDALEIVLVYPVFTGFQRSSSGTADGTPAGGTGGERKKTKNLDFGK